MRCTRSPSPWVRVQPITRPNSCTTANGVRATLRRRRHSPTRDRAEPGREEQVDARSPPGAAAIDPGFCRAETPMPTAYAASASASSTAMHDRRDAAARGGRERASGVGSLTAATLGRRAGAGRRRSGRRGSASYPRTHARAPGGQPPGYEHEPARPRGDRPRALRVDRPRRRRHHPPHPRHRPRPAGPPRRPRRGARSSAATARSTRSSTACWPTAPGHDVPVLGTVPGGSANVFARSVGLPEDPVEATGALIEAIEHKRTRTDRPRPGRLRRAAAVVHLQRRPRRRRGDHRGDGAPAGRGRARPRPARYFRPPCARSLVRTDRRVPALDRVAAPACPTSRACSSPSCRTPRRGPSSGRSRSTRARGPRSTPASTCSRRAAWPCSTRWATCGACSSRRRTRYPFGGLLEPARPVRDDHRPRRGRPPCRSTATRRGPCRRSRSVPSRAPSGSSSERGPDAGVRPRCVTKPTA